MYTSGTTGLPKGVELSDRNLMSHLSFLDSGAFGPWSEEDIQLICLPLFHIGGTDSGLWSLYTGAMSLLLTDANTGSIIDAFARYRVSIAGFVPTIMRAILADPGVGKLDFSSLKLISYGGSPISPELMVQARETFGCRFQQLFGMTETTGGVSILSDEDHRGDDTVAYDHAAERYRGPKFASSMPRGASNRRVSPGKSRCEDPRSRRGTGIGQRRRAAHFATAGITPETSGRSTQTAIYSFTTASRT